MTQLDLQGNHLTGASAAAASAYGDALRQLSIYAGDPLAVADRLVEDEPGFGMAHVLKAWLFLLGTDAKAAAAAREVIAKAEALDLDSREQGHIAAINHLIEGRFHAASRVLEGVAAEHPRDLLALIAGHQLDFFTGSSQLLRDRILRAMPAWSNSQPGYHAMLGMRAFGLEEMGDYAGAEASGRAALEIERCDGWARHAVAHVMEMQGRQDEGIAFMREDIDSWTAGSFFAVHNWWHLALYHLELGQLDEVLKLVDGPILNAPQEQMLDLVDASAMLWRLQLRDVELGRRWTDLARRYEALWVPGYYAFNDLHAAMAFLGAGQSDQIERIIAAQGAAEADNLMFSQHVGLPLIRAFVAFHEGRYREAIPLLQSVRGISSRFGGSHAQRDIIELTLIEAAIRGGEADLAQSLGRNRLQTRHDSPLAQLLARRAGLNLAA
ncbi:MAG: tetratricopeptide repeat protein [Aestuariivirga sp.]